MNVEPVVQLGYLIGHAEAHNWVILSCWVHVSHVAKHNWVISCAAHNWVILSSWVRVSHGGTTGLFHSSTQLGYLSAGHNKTTGLFFMHMTRCHAPPFKGNH